MALGGEGLPGGLWERIGRVPRELALHPGTDAGLLDPTRRTEMGAWRLPAGPGGFQSRKSPSFSNYSYTHQFPRTLSFPTPLLQLVRWVAFSAQFDPPRRLHSQP